MAATLNTESSFNSLNAEHLNLSIAIQDQESTAPIHREHVLNFLLNSLNEHTDSL